MPCVHVSKKRAKLLFGVSVLTLIISLGLIFGFNGIYDSVLKQQTSLVQGSRFSKSWEEMYLPIYQKLYFFNITNREFFLKGMEPLKVTEVGPYTYISRWVKHNPQYNPNHTVSYRETRTFHFAPDMSTGTEDDMIYTLNGPMIMAANTVPESLRIYFDYFCLLIGEKVVIKRSIRDLAFEGYEDAIVQNGVFLKQNLLFKDDKFAWLYGRNATDDGIYTIYSGTGDYSKKGLINNYNGNERLSFWKGDSCNSLNATNIEIGPPINDDEDSYTFFQSLLCRSFTFNYTHDAVHYGIHSKRFKPTYNIFANSSSNPNNYCFEAKKTRPSGVLDLSPCVFGAPVLISFPHFHLADPSYLNAVKGLNPGEERHGSHIDIEPVTGLTIDAMIRLQLNVEIQQLRDFYIFDEVSKGVFPIFWAEYTFKIDRNLATTLQRILRDWKVTGYTLIGIALVISWTGVVASIVLLCMHKMNQFHVITATDKIFPSLSKCCGFKIYRVSAKQNITNNNDEEDRSPNANLSVYDSVLFSKDHIMSEVIMRKNLGPKECLI